MIGIYKITSPTGRIYIGQSINIEKRFKWYNKLRTTQQIKLHNSLIKYGVENHLFEIVTECDRKMLNELEIYYITEFNCIKQGLNCMIGGANPGVCEETRVKMSNSAKGRVAWNKGKPFSEMTKKAMSEAATGRKATEATKKILSTKRKGTKPRAGVLEYGKFTEKRSKSMLGKNTKPVVDLKTGIIFLSVGEAADFFKIKGTTLIAMLKGQNKNKTTLTYFKK